MMNLLWLVFAVAGGVIAGATTSAVAATELTRRRLRGGSFPVFREYARAWRRCFRRANVGLTPVAAFKILLAVSAVGQFSARALHAPLGIATSVALILTFGVTAIGTAMLAHYELPAGALVKAASRWAWHRFPDLLLLVSAAALVFAVSLLVPGVVPFLSVGSWITVSTALCIGFFQANERRLLEHTISMKRKKE
ncbi:DUF624 domain-containing protein [Microbacterium sp. GXF0217]